MEAQYHTALAPHHDHPFYASAAAYPLHSDQYLATAGEVDFADNFLGGSSPSYPDPHEDYRYGFHRGPDPSSYHYRTETTSIPDALDATGLEFSGNTATLLVGNLFPAEELALCAGHHQRQPWSWSQAQAQASIHGVVAPVPVLPSPPEATFLAIKSKQLVPPRPPFVRSPDPPLPTPAGMAVLLSSGPRSDVQSVVVGGVHGMAAPGPTTVAQDIHGNCSREKKHACTMCHKRFDRPSTLRKHLLVHTGEKAFVCDICGRRFGVASNLNRHVKRCALKPVNMTAGSPPKSPSDSPSSADETSSPIAQSPKLSLARSPLASQHKRGSISSLSSSSSRGRNSMSPLQSPHSSVPLGASTKATQKRRRRAPSPSRWVPLSLLSFNLVSEDMYRSVSVPLPPVRRNLPKEERDSWDENVAPAPYHPNGWKGVLPGPGIPRGRDTIGKMYVGGGGCTGTFMSGRLLSI